MLDSRRGDPWGPGCWDSIAKHIPNPDVGAIVKSGSDVIMCEVDFQGRHLGGTRSTYLTHTKHRAHDPSQYLCQIDWPRDGAVR